MEEHRKTAWQIRKEVSIGDLIAFLTMMFIASAAYFNLDKRVALVEEGNLRQQVTDRAQDAERHLIKAEVGARLDRFEGKLDWLIEHVNKK